MDTATLDYLRNLAEQLQTAKHGQKTPLIEKSAVFLNCSPKQVYELLKQAGLTAERKTRTDKGKSSITKEQAELIGGMILVATRANGKRILSVKTACEMLQAQGKLPDVDTTTILRALRGYHCHPDQLATPTAHVQQRSLHPNHVWQIDASVCVLFYMPKGGMAVMEEKEFYKNKPKNIAKIANERVIRYVITDHYSGAIYCEYVMGAESSENLIQVFTNAIQKREHNDPLHGVPFLLGMDKGSANMSRFFLNFLERLNITPVVHATGNSRAKGSVEKAQDIVECNFESRLTFLKIQSLEELNAYATKWRTHFNANAVHSRHNHTRNRIWGSITRDQLRLAPSLDICRELVTTKPKAIKVRGDLTVTHTIRGYPNQSYDLTHLPDLYPRAEVELVVNPYRVPDIDVHWQGKVYTVSPVTVDNAGFIIHAPVIGEQMIAKPDSMADTNRKAMMKQAYNADTEAQVDKARKAKQSAYAGMIDPMADINASHDIGNVPTVITKAGTPNAIEIAKRNLESLSHVVAAQTIKGLVGDLWTAEHYRQLVKQYPNQVPAEAIELFAENIRRMPTKQDETLHFPKAVNQ